LLPAPAAPLPPPDLRSDDPSRITTAAATAARSSAQHAQPRSTSTCPSCCTLQGTHTSGTHMSGTHTCRRSPTCCCPQRPSPSLPPAACP
jgi:hypothetical protein